MINFLNNGSALLEFTSNYKGTECTVYCLTKNMIQLYLYSDYIYIKWDQKKYKFSWSSYDTHDMPVDSLIFLGDFIYYLLELYPELKKYKKKERRY